MTANGTEKQHGNGIMRNVVETGGQEEEHAVKLEPTDDGSVELGNRVIFWDPDLPESIANSDSEEEQSGENLLAATNRTNSNEVTDQSEEEEEEESKDTIYRCPGCDFATQTKDFTEIHMRLTHPERFRFKCVNCMHPFISAKHLRQHIREMHT